MVNQLGLLGAIALMYCRFVSAQTILATDASLVMEVPGVSLTLKSTGCGSTGVNRSGSSLNVVASMYDVQHAVDTLVNVT